MLRPVAKWLLGAAAFVSPLLVALIGQRLDHSAFRNDSMYKALIPFFVFGSLAAAALVPAILLLRSRAPVWRRVGCLVGVWCLLAIELYWTFLSVVLAR